MSSNEEMREDAKQDAVEDERQEMMPERCGCSESATWKCVGRDSNYGADADGRRGCLYLEWECSECGVEVGVTYNVFK